EFLELLATNGNVTVSAEAFNLERARLYEIRKTDKTFADASDAAMQQAADHLEAEARRRAVDGWDEPVYWQGEQVGVVRKFSDTLLIFLMKGANPEKYRDRVDHTTKGKEIPGPGVVAINVYLPDNERDAEGA